MVSCWLSEVLSVCQSVTLSVILLLDIFLFLHKNICCGYSLEMPIFSTETFVFMEK